MLQQSSGRRVASASRDTTILLELVAIPASAGRLASSAANTSRLTDATSTTASIAHAAPEAARGRSLIAVTPRAAASAASRSSLPFSTRRSSSCRFDAIARCSSSGFTWTSATSIPWSAACWEICAPIVPAPTTSKRPSAPAGTVMRSRLVGPADRHPRGALGQLLGRFHVANDGREIAFELQPAEHDPLGRVELLLRDLLPSRVRAGDDELRLLRILRGADADIARFTVPEIEEDAKVLRKVLVGLGEHDEADRPLP